MFKTVTTPRNPVDGALFYAAPGYMWIEGNTSGGAAHTGEFLVPMSGMSGHMGRSYDVMVEEPGLFLEAAALPHTKEAIATFSARCGQLHANPPDVFPAFDRDPITGRLTASAADRLTQLGREVFGATMNGKLTRTEGVSFQDWVHELQDLANYVTLWRALQAARDTGDHAELQRLLSRGITPHRRGLFDFVLDPRTPPPPKHGGYLPEGGIHADTWIETDGVPTGVEGPRAYIFAAAHFLESKVGGMLRTRTTVAVTRRRRSPDLALIIRPRGVSGAVWLQFARALEGNRDYRQCAECDRWWEAGPDGRSRSHKAYCSNACKQRAYRRRRKATNP